MTNPRLLAHIGADQVPMMSDMPVSKRVACNTATRVKITAATLEKVLMVMASFY